MAHRMGGTDTGGTPREGRAYPEGESRRGSDIDVESKCEEPPTYVW